jgi:hypothetical protein
MQAAFRASYLLVRADLQVSVAEDRALRKRILSGFQGYFALKQKNAKQLHARKFF